MPWLYIYEYVLVPQIYWEFPLSSSAFLIHIVRSIGIVLNRIFYISIPILMVIT